MTGRLATTMAGLTSIRLGARQKQPWPAAKLGLLERWYAAQPVARVAAVVIEWIVPFDAEAMVAALKQVRAAHPNALAVTLTRGDARPQRQALPAKTPLPVADASVDDVWSLTEQALHEPFVAGEALWRAYWTPNRQALVAVFHHVIADGMSAAIFARHVVRALNGDALEVAAQQAPLETAIDIRPSLGLMLREVKTAVLKAPDADFYRGSDQRFASLRTQLTTHVLSRATVDAIAHAARLEQTTVHAALVAAAVHASAVHLDQFPLRARVVSPVSLRRSMTPAATGMGVFLCAVESDHVVQRDQRFWEFARNYGRALRDGIPKATQRVGLLAHAGDLGKLAQRITDDAHNARTATVEVSNLGRMQFDASGHARVWFTQGNHYHGPLFNLSTVTDADSGNLMLCLATPSPLIDRAHAQRFLETLRDVLTRATESSRSASF